MVSGKVMSQVHLINGAWLQNILVNNSQKCVGYFVQIRLQRQGSQYIFFVIRTGTIVGLAYQVALSYLNFSVDMVAHVGRFADSVFYICLSRLRVVNM